MKIIRYFEFILILILITINYLPAQDYVKAFQEGRRLFEAGAYYEAYWRFNAAVVLGDNAGKSEFVKDSQDWLNKSALGIQEQQQITDSLLKVTQKLTDAFYFYDNRLALAFNGLRYGFIDKEGEVAIEYLYESAGNFDETTGYAKVIKNGMDLWLAPDGKEYPGHQDVLSLPNIEREGQKAKGEELFKKKSITPDKFQIKGAEEYLRVLIDGIKFYNEGKYYDAYLRFHAASVLANNAGNSTVLRLSTQYRDTSVHEMRSLFTRAEKALTVAKNIREAFYFYEDKFALAFNNGSFYFINENGDEFTHLGRWTKAKQFEYVTGLAEVKNEKNVFLLDTDGQTYNVVHALEHLHENITALNLRNVSLNSFPKEITANPQLQILILDGVGIKGNQTQTIPNDIQQLTKLKVFSMRRTNLSVLPPKIGRLDNLNTLDLSYNNLSSLPPEIGQLKNLKKLYLYENNLYDLPPEIGQLGNLTKLYLKSNHLKDLPPQIGQLKNLTDLDLWNNQLNRLPPQIVQLKNLKELGLRSNQLRSLPSEIGWLNNLEKLYLGNNLLKKLPPEIGSLHKLTRLYLSNNQLTELPREIGWLGELKDLDLRENQLRSLPKEIGQLKHLTTLDLRQNPISEQEQEKIQRLLPQCNIYFSEIDHYQAGQEALREQKYQEALSAFLKDIQKKQRPGSYGYAGLCHYLLDNMEEASDYLNKYLDLDPNNPWTLKYLSNIYVAQGEFSKVWKMKYLEELNLEGLTLMEIPHQVFELENLKKLNLARNKLKSLPSEISHLKNLQMVDLRHNPISLDQQKNIKKLLPKCKVYFTEINYFEFGQNAFNDGNYQDALIAWLKDIEINETPASFGNAGLCYRLLDQPKEALEYLHRYLDLKPDNPWTIRQIASAHFDLKDYTSAYSFAKKASVMEPKNAYVWFDLSWYALLVNDPLEAIQAAQKTLEINPDAITVNTNLALGYLLSNQWNKAEEIYNTWKGKEYPGDIESWDLVFLQDIEVLKESGINHPDFEKVKDLFRQ